MAQSPKSGDFQVVQKKKKQSVERAAEDPQGQPSLELCGKDWSAPTRAQLVYGEEGVMIITHSMT